MGRLAFVTAGVFLLNEIVECLFHHYSARFADLLGDGLTSGGPSVAGQPDMRRDRLDGHVHPFRLTW